MLFNNINFCLIKSTSEEDSSSSSSESGSDSTLSPVQSKVGKGSLKKDKGQSAKKKKLSAKQQLARKAAKKGANKSINSIKKHIKEAEEISSETIGARVQQVLKIINDEIEEWHLAGVENHVIQKFAALILKKLKDLNVLVAVDHVIFQKELNFIHPVDMDIVDDQILSRKQVTERAGKLLEQLLDPEQKSNLQNSMQGNTWSIDPKGPAEADSGKRYCLFLMVYNLKFRKSFEPGADQKTRSSQ